MLSDEWLSRYGLLENFNASVTRTRTGTGTGTWTTEVTAIALCTSCSRANYQPKAVLLKYLDLGHISIHLYHHLSGFHNIELIKFHLNFKFKILIN